MAVKSKVTNIWYTCCPVVCASHIAQNLGWLREEFARDGIQVLHISHLPPEKWRCHYSHRYPQLFRDGNNIPPIWTKSEGVETNVIGMEWMDERHTLMVAKDSPIRSVAELRGKRIALPRRLCFLIDFYRGMTKRGVAMALQANGLTLDDVRLVDLPIDILDMAKEKSTAATECATIRYDTGWKIPRQVEVEALQRGEVDAIFASSMEPAILEKAGLVRSLYHLDKHPDWRYRVNHGYVGVITVNSDFAQNHPDLVIRWLKVIIRAGRWAKEHHAEVLSIIAKETNTTEAVVQKSLAPDFHHHLVPEISEKGIEALEIQRQFLREHGFINNDFDVRGWVDGHFLSTALRELATG